MLYIMYSNECCGLYEDMHIIKYADDSVIVSLLQKQDLGHGQIDFGRSGQIKDFKWFFVSIV